MTDEAALKEAVVEALNGVVDPCGLFNGSMTTIGDLGMYRDIIVSDDTVHIEVFLDDPSCAFAGQIMIDIAKAVDPLAEGRKVEMSLVVDDYWDVDRVNATGRQKLDQAQEKRRRMLPLRVASGTRSAS
ncbi:metal-sulfur cluster assembly factor [Herbiconiux daphne]|uniref:Iron-sulfur cluster assembly protein n=1 Tax=Herbiconiux daphne TaxID=2970914 RepID=A0ABT2H3M5_9MICO|nr:iron-sulfur cluster assembly protein [Herbiconiux daphne]MCS5734535.1 iron-sulfur cluster assembly protein [Herbiconiux daphne]